MTLLATRYLFTVDEFDRMGEAGIFTEDDRVELIRGEIVEMSPIGDPHINCVDRLTYLLVPPLQGRAIVRVQSPVKLFPDSEPEPDVTLLRWREDFYASERPTIADILLIIEVADSSLRYDLETKLPLYAERNIPETWVANVVTREVTVARDPGPQGYRDIRVLRGDDRLSPLAFPDVILTPEQLFPQAHAS